MRRLLILSGKGGTGKTTTAAAFIRFSQTKAIADCDVDAPNLHLILAPKTDPIETDFFGLDKAVIDAKKCTDCGLCEKVCRFDAVSAGKAASADSALRRRAMLRLSASLSLSASVMKSP